MKAAVIGAGRMGQIRALACAELGVEVVAVCDPLFDRAVALADRVRAKGFSNGLELPWSELDALFLCTPPSVREELGLRAIHSQTALFLEKPAGLSAEEGKPLLAALAKDPVVTAVGYHNRCRPSVRSLRQELVGQKILGAVGVWAGGRYSVPWWSVSTESGGPFNEQCTHFVDLARHLIGEITDIKAVAIEPSSSAESVAVILTFETGVLGTIFYSCQAREKQISFRILTESKEHRLEGWDLRSEGESPKPKNAVFVDETSRFLDAVRLGKPSLVPSTLADAINTQRVVDTIVHSFAQDQR